MKLFSLRIYKFLRLTLFILALVACNTETAPISTISPAATLPASTSTPVIGGDITIAGIGQPSHEVTHLPRFISGALYDSLLQIDPANGSLKPGLSDTWQVSDDARTFTFHLRAGVRWHDDTPLTAQDVVFTIKTLSNPAQRLTPATDFGPLADVTAPDAQTVNVKLSEAYCAALTNLGALKILPQHILENKNLATLAPEQFIGTGPLILKTWNQDVIIFTRNADYWQGAPPIEDWTYKIFANETDARTALNAGQVDVLTQNSSVANVKTFAYAANQFYALAFNQERDVLRDTHVRQAFAAALDRAKLAKDLFGDDAQVLETSALKDFWANAPDAAQPTYDPARAKQLLADAGWRDVNNDGLVEKDGKPLRVTLYAITNDPVIEPLTFAVRAMLAQVGAQALLQLDDRADLLTRVFMHEYDLALAAWNIPLDPDQHWYWQANENTKGQGLNFGSYTNPQMNDLLQQGNRAAKCDSTARRTIYANAYRLLAQDVPQVFLFAPPAYLSARPRVLGLAPSSFAGECWNLHTWQVQP